MLEAALREYSKGNPAPVKAALAAALEILGASSRPGELTPIWNVDKDWVWALGRQGINRVKKLLTEIVSVNGWVDAQYSLSADNRLHELVKELRWVESKVREDEDAFQHGPFQIIRMPGVSRAGMDGALTALDSATEALSRKFPQVLYGKIFVTPTLPKATSVAQYTNDKDVIYLSLKAKNTIGDVFSLIHEFGHRYQHKFWTDQESRMAFMLLSTSEAYETVTVTPEEKAKWADELIRQLEARRENKPGIPNSPGLDSYMDALIQGAGTYFKITKLLRDAVEAGPAGYKTFKEGFLQLGPWSYHTQKVVQKPIHVTPYGATAWTENFSEAFAMYNLGKELPEPIKKIMDKLV